MAPSTDQKNIDFKQILLEFAQFGIQVATVIESLRTVVRNNAPKIIELLDAVQKMPEAVRQGVIGLANEGWYLDMNGMSLMEPVELAKMYSDGKRLEVEQRLVEHFRRRLFEIEQELLELVPSRAHIFRQAFNAHRLQLFYLTVPAILAQADGICLENLGEHYFMKKKGAKDKERFQDLNTLEDLTKAMLAPFFNNTSINASAKDRPQGFSKLNRHVVIHGESLDYGSEISSLQAISFLYFVAVSVGQISRELNLTKSGVLLNSSTS